jgi:hypothetical protein
MSILTSSQKSLVINNKLNVDNSILKANKLDYLIESSTAMFKDGEMSEANVGDSKNLQLKIEPTTKPSETAKSWRRATNLEPIKDPEPICKSTKECNNLITKYKNICRTVWDEKCDNDNTIEKLTAISNNAKSCVSSRENYQKECCMGIDQGHVGAILKMKRLADKCETIRFNKLTNL